MVLNLSLLKCDMETLEPTFILITPLEDTLEFEHLEYEDLRDWETDEIIDIDNARFLLSAKRVRGCPILLRDRVVFSPTIFLLKPSTPFHCGDCADQWCLWFCEKQYEWGMSYHAHWYREYVGGEGEARRSFH